MKTFLFLLCLCLCACDSESDQRKHLEYENLLAANWAKQNLGMEVTKTYCRHVGFGYTCIVVDQYKSIRLNCKDYCELQ